MGEFIHLRVHSDYSLGEGTCRIKDLIKKSLECGMPASCLSDKYNLFGSLEFSLEAKKNNLQPIIGMVSRIRYAKNLEGDLLLIALTDEGYRNLLMISSEGYLKRTNDAKPSVDLDYLFAHSAGLAAFVGGPESLERQLFNDSDLETPKNNIGAYKEVFGKYLFIELTRSFNPEDTEIEYENYLLDIAEEYNIPIVATNEVCFIKKDQHLAHDAFICISQGRYVLEDDRKKSNEQSYFLTKGQMAELFADLPEALANTELIAKLAQTYAITRDPLLPSFCEDEDQELVRQARVGLKERIKGFEAAKQAAYCERLEYELKVITKMHYSGYFLIVSDFIKWSKAQGIPVGPGRGSGAGSIVAWCVSITDLDPIRYGLLFERFLNPERVSMPDFDIDFCQDRREEVIEYVMHKFGADRVAQIITFGKLQARAVLRDVGRVLHMPYGLIDKICKMVPSNPANPVMLKEAISLDKELQKSAENDPDIDRLLKISLELEGLNRHVSTHAAGVIIADRPLVEIIPLYKDLNSNMNAVQYSMKYAEAAGLVKFDFLGLKTLTVISWACNLINREVVKINLASINTTDTKTFEMLARGETIGVFQFESAGMKEAIKKLKPDCIDDLIALGSLYRPGPMDNIPSYINRKHGTEKPEYLHPLMESILKETYGIIVYQEQVMEIARVLGGYTMGGADLLRRAMGKKIKAEMDAQQSIFVDGAISNGINKSLAQEIFALMEKFASYGFNKSHAAAYAIISYQTAYIKANYPLEYMVASLNLEINDTDKLSLFIQESKRLGLKILPVDINYSQATFTIEGEAIRYGLSALKNVGGKAADEISVERSKNGLFKGIFDLLERVPEGVINKRIIESLARAGAFDEFEKNRHMLYLNSELLARYAHSSKNDINSKQIGLFDLMDDANMDKPKLANVESWDFMQQLKAEFDTFGFYLSNHPLEPHEAKLVKLGASKTIEVEGKARLHPRGLKVNFAGVLTSKKIRSSPKGKYAFIQFTDQYGLIEASIFDEILLIKNEELLKVGNVLYIRAEVRVDNSGVRCVIENIMPIEDAVANVQTRVKLIISNKESIPIVQKLISNEGTKEANKEANICYRLESGELVSFNFKHKIYFSDEALEELKKAVGVEIIELC